MKDAYDRLFARYPKEEFFKDSIEEVIFVSPDALYKNWEEQKQKLLNNGELYIRGYGRDGTGTHFFLTLYRNLFSNSNIKKDPTNNARPTKVLSELTGYCKVIRTDNAKKERVQNYQVSHLFGRTKNPLLFTAAWNVAFIPKYLDPFTGHETQGAHRSEFQKMFDAILRARFKDYIEDYNSFIFEEVAPRLEEALLVTKNELGISDKGLVPFRSDSMAELSTI